MTQDTATRNVVVEREMAHSAEKIWRALTQGMLIEQWLMRTDFKPVVGLKFNFWAEPGPQWNGITDCEVLVVEPHTQLTYSWNSSGEEAATGLRTVVSWTLTPTEGGTMVRMEQSGFRADQENNRKGANYGWAHFFKALEEVAGKQE